MSIYDFSFNTLDGQATSMAEYKGKVLLIVNTASKCGFTPQYEGLEALNKRYGTRGLVIIGFPCNQFGNQEPGDNAAIGSFCQKNYGVTFCMAEKIDVNGNNAAPLYKFLKDAQPGILNTEAIKWNFTKFLIGRDGEVIERFAPTTKPESLEDKIEAALSDDDALPAP